MQEEFRSQKEFAYENEKVHDRSYQEKILKIEESDGLEWLRECFHCLRNLRYLTLRKLSKFTVFPTAFGNLHSLRYLRLEDCVALEGLPSSFGGLQSLREMHITSCQNLQSLWTDRITGCRLENLLLIRISKCLRLQILPQSFGELGALKRLTIGCCDDHENKPALIRSLDLVATRSGQIRSGDHERVVQSIGPISRLQKLRLSHCGSPRGSLDHLTALTSMDIEGCHTFKNLLHSLLR
ncbi:hypothetical protein Mapa_002124 [Marchantia paleacea]|nr:hypothetical protein Mapa_002124 [Marchantia paleacea]